MDDLVKMTVHITPENRKNVEDLAKSTRTTMTTVVNQAIITEKFIRDACLKGSKVLIEDKNGNTTEIVFR